MLNFNTTQSGHTILEGLTKEQLSSVAFIYDSGSYLNISAEHVDEIINEYLNPQQIQNNRAQENIYQAFLQ